jgi:hypothetical protein
MIAISFAPADTITVGCDNLAIVHPHLSSLNAACFVSSFFGARILAVRSQFLVTNLIVRYAKQSNQLQMGAITGHLIPDPAILLSAELCCLLSIISVCKKRCVAIWVGERSVEQVRIQASCVPQLIVRTLLLNGALVEYDNMVHPLERRNTMGY